MEWPRREHAPGRWAECPKMGLGSFGILRIWVGRKGRRGNRELGKRLNIWEKMAVIDAANSWLIIATAKPRCTISKSSSACSSKASIRCSFEAAVS